MRVYGTVHILRDQMIGHLDHTRWATSTFLKSTIVRPRVQNEPISYSFGMCVLETVNRLIVVTYDADISVTT